MKRIVLFLATSPAVLVPEAPKGALLEMMDTAYQRWLATTRQFYAAPIVATSQGRQTA